MAAAPALMVIGTAIGAVGALSQGQAAAGAARYNAQVNDQNAAIALQQGEADAVQMGQIGVRRVGAVRAAIGASGLRTEGSPLDVLESTASQAEYDVQRVRYNASVRATGFQSNASLDRTRARSAETQALFSAASTSLIGGSRASGMGTPGAGTPIPLDTGGYGKFDW